MATDGSRPERFGWFFGGNGMFSEAYVTWPNGAPASVLEGLKTAGFTESPLLHSGHGLGLLVYSRDAAAQQAFPLQNEAQSAQYAVVVRQGDWMSQPIFVTWFPALVRLASEMQPFMTLFEVH